MNPLRLPDAMRRPHIDAWFSEPAKTALYIEYFGLNNTTGLIKVWNGTAWVQKPLKIWNGTAWVQKPVKSWNGTGWVATN